MSVSDRENAPAHLPSAKAPSHRFGSVLLIRPLDDSGVPEHWNLEEKTRDTVWNRRVGTCGTSSKAFESFLAERGLTFDQVAALRFENGRSVPELRFPRNLSWKSLPIVEQPTRRYGFARYGCGHVGKLSPSGHLASLSDPATVPDTWQDLDDEAAHAGLLDGVEVLVIDSAKLDDEAIWAAISPCEADFLAKDIEAFWFDGSNFHPVSKGSLAGAADRMRGADRLVWGHVLNLAMLMPRAIHAVAREENWPKGWFRSRMSGLGSYGFEDVFSPLALQIMYALDRSFPTTDERSREADIWAAMNRLLDACPYVRKSDHGDGLEFVWEGSGRFPPLVAKVRRPFNFDNRDIEDILGNKLPHLLLRMDHTGFIGVGKDGRMGVTSFGHRILEVLGRGAEDPDVLLRWRGSGSDSIPAIDRWLNKTFRAMKRRVTFLPSSPFAEVDCAGAEQPENSEIAYGGYIELNDDALSDPSVAAVVDRIAAENKDKPFGEQRYGLVRNPERMAATPPPKGIWFGVPLVVCEEWKTRVGCFEWYEDHSVHDHAVETIKETLPECLRSRSTQEPLLLIVGETNRPVETFSPSLTCATAEDRRNSDRLMVGWVSHVTDVDERGPEFTRSVNMLQGLRSTMSFGGYAVQGAVRLDDGSAWIWEGLEIGIVRPSGEGVIAAKDANRLKRSMTTFLKGTLRSMSVLREAVADQGTFGLFLVRGRNVPQQVEVDTAAIMDAVEHARLDLAQEARS